VNTACATPAQRAYRHAMRLVEFNLHVARYAHRSWYPQGIGMPLVDERGRPEPRAELQLSDWLLRESSLHRDMDWRMEEPAKRLWLLDGPALERLLLEAAVALHRESLMRVIDGERVRTLERWLDASLWRFVMEELPPGLSNDHPPAVDFERGEPESLEESLRADGARTLLSLLRSEWRAVRGRAQMRFDIGLARERSPAVPAAQAKRVLELIVTQLIPGRFAEWAWLF
jgi:hypothetical protein